MCRDMDIRMLNPNHTPIDRQPPPDRLPPKIYLQVAATQAYLSALNRVAVSRGSLPVHPQFGKI